MVEPTKARGPGRPRKIEAAKSTLTTTQIDGGSSNHEQSVQVSEGEEPRSGKSKTCPTHSPSKMASPRTEIQPEKGRGTHLETAVAGVSLQQALATQINKNNSWVKIVIGDLEEYHPKLHHQCNLQGPLRQR
ncbi:unnamed protein product [Amaranthus hypochondriacus]